MRWGTGGDNLVQRKGSNSWGHKYNIDYWKVRETVHLWAEWFSSQRTVSRTFRFVQRLRVGSSSNLKSRISGSLPNMWNDKIVQKSILVPGRVIILARYRRKPSFFGLFYLKSYDDENTLWPGIWKSEPNFDFRPWVLWTKWSFHTLGNEPEILDFKFKDGTTLSLWTNRKVRKMGFAPKERPKAENRTSVRTFIFQVT